MTHTPAVTRWLVRAYTGMTKLKTLLFVALIGFPSLGFAAGDCPCGSDCPCGVAALATAERGATDCPWILGIGLGLSLSAPLVLWLRTARQE